MKKIGIIIIAFVSLLAVSCNPDYVTAKDAEGTWKLYKLSDGTTTTEEMLGESLLIFTNVSKDGGDFQYKYTYLGVTNTSEGTFTITEKGTKIVTTETDGSSETALIDISKDELVITDNDNIRYYRKQ